MIGAEPMRFAPLTTDMTAPGVPSVSTSGQGFEAMILRILLQPWTFSSPGLMALQRIPVIVSEYLVKIIIFFFEVRLAIVLLICIFLNIICLSVNPTCHFPNIFCMF